MADNEALKRDVAELQNILAEAREDNRVLLEEIEEVKANSSRSVADCERNAGERSAQ